MKIFLPNICKIQNRFHLLLLFENIFFSWKSIDTCNLETNFMFKKLMNLKKFYSLITKLFFTECNIISTY